MPSDITEAQSESLHKAMLASLDMEPLGEAFERVWDANTDKLYEPATQAGDDALVEELALVLYRGLEGREPDAKPRGAWTQTARAILPILHRREATAHAAGRAENYKTFTDGMEAASQICGSLAETTYDDADAFEAATGCEAAIMRVVKEQREEQANAINPETVGETE